MFTSLNAYVVGMILIVRNVFLGTISPFHSNNENGDRFGELQTESRECTGRWDHGNYCLSFGAEYSEKKNHFFKNMCGSHRMQIQSFIFFL